jgi:hypothetical protein
MEKNETSNERKKEQRENTEENKEKKEQTSRPGHSRPSGELRHEWIKNPELKTRLGCKKHKKTRD